MYTVSFALRYAGVRGLATEVKADTRVMITCVRRALYVSNMIIS